MKVYRYMSLKEFSKMSCGMVMTSEKKFTRCNTASEGFCFIGEKTAFECFLDGKMETIEYSAKNCYEFLCGIVARDGVLVEFETQPENVRESWGVYAMPINFAGDDFDATIEIVEYCADQYSIDTFQPLRYAMCGRMDVGEWYNYN